MRITDSLPTTGPSVPQTPGPAAETPLLLRGELVRILLRNRVRQQVAGHEHVVVRVVVERRGLAVLPAGVGVELSLEPEHVGEQVGADGRLRQLRRRRQEVPERDRVLLQVGHRLRLTRLVVLRGRDGVVDEELDVGAPHVLAVQEHVAGFRAVHGGDRLRQCHGVPVERLCGGRERLRPLHAGVGRVHREHRMLAELAVEQDAQVACGRRLGLRVVHPGHAGHRAAGERGDGEGKHRGEGRERGELETHVNLLCRWARFIRTGPGFGSCLDGRRLSGMKRAIVVAALLALCITGAAAAQGSTGDLRVLVIRATWGPAPDGLAQLSDAAPFYDRASFGELRLHFDITPWLAAYSGPVCPSDGEAAKAAARTAGYDVASYARVVYVIPEQVCDFRGVTRGNEILLAAPQALVHELGHTFGLGHATAYACAKPCRHLDEYGDPLSPMGHGTVDFSAYEKLQLGWISSVQRVDRSRTYAVADIDVASVAPQALVVPAAAGEYWIEHRSTGLVVRLVKAKRSIFLAQPRQR